MLAERSFTAALASGLHDQCAAAAQLANATGQPTLACFSVPVPTPDDPTAWFTLVGRLAGFRAYWERPEAGFALVGGGVARSVAATSEQPWRDAAMVLRTGRAHVAADDLTRELGGPYALGGFAFDPAQPAAPEWAGFPAGLLVVPRALLQLRDERATLTVSVEIAPGADWVGALTAALVEVAPLGEPVQSTPESAPVDARDAAEAPAAADWRGAVARTAADIRAGHFTKVVLARRLDVALAGDADLAETLRRLRANYPGAYVFAVETTGGCFLGATPERLVRLDGREVVTLCLAGTAARGATPDEDEQLAAALLHSPKNREEHAVVVGAIRDALAPLCDELLLPDAPHILRVRNLQHLATPVRARLVGDACVLDLVAHLHPTPAVAGLPRAAALAAIREREGFDRGWYAGPVGWVDGAGGGEFAVALRSALLTPGHAALYAGCGIMGDSDPDAEYAETGLKFQPMLNGLQVAG
ncbi:MAG: isochorismate synthase [Thermomicrobiales bacterium]